MIRDPYQSLLQSEFGNDLHKVGARDTILSGFRFNLTSLPIMSVAALASFPMPERCRE